MWRAIRADARGHGAIEARHRAGARASTPFRSRRPHVKVLTVVLFCANAILGIGNLFLSIRRNPERNITRVFSKWGKIAKGRHSPSCAHTRGRNGTWVPAEGYDYGTPPKGERHGGSNFSSVTKWAWKDDPSAPKCPFDRVTKSGFCRIMSELGLDRIFFVGDSLSFGMAESLWKLLGHKDGPGSQKRFIERQVRCGNGTADDRAAEAGASIRRDVAFAYVRNDHLREDERVFLTSPKWKGPYTKTSSSGTLLVANTGLHIRNTEDFERSMRAFVDDVVAIKASRPDDIAVFRTSVPGHAGCENRTAPFGSAAEYVPTTEYRWDKVSGYNDIARRHVSDATTADGPLRGSLYLLDVYPMTLLRPDGHRLPPRDCLHYEAPGPQDWWNHLLYNMLLDFGAARSHSGPGQRSHAATSMENIQK